MSGSHLHDDTLDAVYTCNKAAINIEGLQNWLRNLKVIGEEDGFLRVVDANNTKRVYLIKEVKDES